jgi:hypothetical protein
MEHKEAGEILRLELFPPTRTNMKRKFSLRRTADV